MGWGRAQRTVSVGKRVPAGCPLVPTDTCLLECPGGETREKEGVGSWLQTVEAIHCFSTRTT